VSGGGTVLITDEMLAAAAKELSLAMITVFPDPEKEIHNFSLRFNQRMKKLVRQTVHPMHYLWTRRIAGFILALFVGFMMVFAISPSVRASVIGWIKEKYESYIEYFFPDNQDNTTIKSFSITILPEGYEEVERLELDTVCMVQYSNLNGSFIDFVYSKDPEAGNMMVKAEGTTIIHTNVQGYEADLYSPNNLEDATGIIWYNNRYNTIFYISALCSDTEIIAMANSVNIIN
jgi:hypothetical protein